MALIGLPVACYFLLYALPLGALLGFALWKLHNSDPYATAGKRR
jgi:hypothetical protein